MSVKFKHQSNCTVGLDAYTSQCRQIAENQVLAVPLHHLVRLWTRHSHVLACKFNQGWSCADHCFNLFQPRVALSHLLTDFYWPGRGGGRAGGGARPGGGPWGGGGKGLVGEAGGGGVVGGAGISRVVGGSARVGGGV